MASAAEMAAAAAVESALQQQRELAERMTSFEANMRAAFDTQLQQIRDANTTEMKNVITSHAETVKLLIVKQEDRSNAKPRYNDKLSEKSYKRIEKFSGGELIWQDWKYDFEILTGALNKDVALELRDSIKKPEPRTGYDI